MSRAVWFVAGAGAGVYGMLRARRAAEALSVDGLRDRVEAAVVGARMFRDEVAQGKSDAESRLREQMTVRLHELESDAQPSELPPGASTTHDTTRDTTQEASSS